jgi:glycosidase
MVVNHAGRAARVVTQHPDWFHDPATCASLGDPSIYCPIGGSPLPDFAQEKPPVASYLDAMCLGWASRFAIDGIRMDTVKNVQVAFWRDAWIPAVKGARPDLFTVGEVFDEGAAANLRPYLDAGFDSLFDYPRYKTLLDTFAAGGSVDALAARVKEEIAAWGYPRTLMITSFLDNHDNVRFPSVVPVGTAEDEIRARYHLALGALFTLPGIPELYYGDELGMYGAKDPDNRRDMPTWAFSAPGRAAAHAGEALPDAQGTFAWVQKLIALRRREPALYQGSYTELWHQGGGTANLYAFLRGTSVLVAINNGTATGAVHVPVQGMLANGSVLDDQAGVGAPATLTVAAGAVTIDLPAKTIAIYRVRMP